MYNRVIIVENDCIGNNAAELKKIAKGFQNNQITMINHSRFNRCSCDPKSFISLLALYIKPNDEVEVIVDGDDAKKVCDIICSKLKNK